MKASSLAWAPLIAMLSGCNVGNAYNRHLVGPYRLIAIDVMEQMSVSYDLGDGSTVGRIDETVFAVGWNERFIVAKQHPKNDRKVTRFYILDMTGDSRNSDPSVCVTGPLTQDEFDSKRGSLKLPGFTETFWTLK
jgi:hypothetical protein